MTYTERYAGYCDCHRVQRIRMLFSRMSSLSLLQTTLKRIFNYLADILSWLATLLTLGGIYLESTRQLEFSLTLFLCGAILFTTWAILKKEISFIIINLIFVGVDLWGLMNLINY